MVTVVGRVLALRVGCRGAGREPSDHCNRPWLDVRFTAIGINERRVTARADHERLANFGYRSMFYRPVALALVDHKSAFARLYRRSPARGAEEHATAYV